MENHEEVAENMESEEKEEGVLIAIIKEMRENRLLYDVSHKKYQLGHKAALEESAKKLKISVKFLDRKIHYIKRKFNESYKVLRKHNIIKGKSGDGLDDLSENDVEPPVEDSKKTWKWFKECEFLKETMNINKNMMVSQIRKKLTNNTNGNSSFDLKSFAYKDIKVPGDNSKTKLRSGTVTGSSSIPTSDPIVGPSRSGKECSRVMSKSLLSEYRESRKEPLESGREKSKGREQASGSASECPMTSMFYNEPQAGPSNYNTPKPKAVSREYLTQFAESSSGSHFSSCLSGMSLSEPLQFTSRVDDQLLNALPDSIQNTNSVKDMSQDPFAVSQEFVTNAGSDYFPPPKRQKSTFVPMPERTKKDVGTQLETSQMSCNQSTIQICPTNSKGTDNFETARSISSDELRTFINSIIDSFVQDYTPNTLLKLIQELSIFMHNFNKAKK